MVTASDGSGDLLVVSSEIIIRSAHRSTSSNLGATGTLVQGDSYPIAYETKRGIWPIWAPRTSSSPFAYSCPATAATAPAAHLRPGHGDGRRRREWRYRRRVCCCRGRSGDSDAGFRTRRRQRGHVRTAEGSHVQEEDAEDGGYRSWYVR